MVKIHHLRIQRVPRVLAFNLLFFVSFFCPNLWASQEAMVLAERAMIYSDQEMTSPIGYIVRGKKIVVGEIPRNKAQVYPVIVSGKVAYVRVIDVTTEKESMDSNRLTAERFQKSTLPTLRGKFGVNYYAFASTIDIDQEVKDDKLLWHGINLKGEVFLKNRFDFQLHANWMQTQKDELKFRAFEIGPGFALRIIDAKRFLFRIEGQLLAIPYTSYAFGEKFRKNSYGYTAGAGAAATIYFNDHWATELSGGVYRTSMLKFDAPAPYEDIEPVFTGLRASIGINYTY
jgi:hypothetical protein